MKKISKFIPLLVFFLTIATMSHAQLGKFRVIGNATQIGYSQYNFLTFGQGVSSSGDWSIEYWNED